MTLQTTAAMGTVGEEVDDLRTYLHALPGCPPVQHTQVLRCGDHDPDGGLWFYVEADAEEAVARRRCLACGTVTPLLDSDAHWTHPPMHTCQSCGQSIVELAVGLHTEPADDAGAPPRVTWLALASRCVECGRIEGLTDAHVDDLTVGQAASRA